MISNYKKVEEFHEAFGLDINKELSNKILENEKLVKLRIALIDEEIKELKEAYKNKDIIETRDAIGDIIYVINGMGVSFGYNIDEEFEKVYKRDKDLSLFQNINKNYLRKIDRIENDKDVFKRQILVDNIEDLFMSLVEHIRIKDLKSIKLYTVYLINQVYLFGYILRINVDEDYRLIHESNMSKLCKNEDEAILTVKSYKNKYEKENSPYDTPDYRLSDNKKYFVVYNKSTGKILKSINYKPVKL